MRSNSTSYRKECGQTRLDLRLTNKDIPSGVKHVNPDRKRVRFETNMEHMTYCVALDPGGTTGVCLVRDSQHPWNLEVAQFEGEHHNILFKFLLATRPLYVICESFENRSQEAALLASREHIGIVKAYIYESGATGIWQSASTGKAFWDDGKLHKAGLYMPGLRHARDAIRHYAYWRTFKVRDMSRLNRKRYGTPSTVTKLPELPSSLGGARAREAT